MSDTIDGRGTYRLNEPSTSPHNVAVQAQLRQDLAAIAAAPRPAHRTSLGADSGDQRTVHQTWRTLEFPKELAEYADFNRIADQARIVGADWTVEHHADKSLTVTLYWKN